MVVNESIIPQTNPPVAPGGNPENDTLRSTG